MILLSNNKNAFPLCRWLEEQGETVYFFSGRLSGSQIRFYSPSFVISYNYRHIISGEIIREIGDRVINLHISYLPWNRGADPNFWSFMDDTPKGVTIHRVSSGLDQGSILVQKELSFDEHVETFQTTYDTLNKEISILFQENWERIKEQSIVPKEQIGEGSCHKKQELVQLLGGKALDLQETIYHHRMRGVLKR